MLNIIEAVLMVFVDSDNSMPFDQTKHIVHFNMRCYFHVRVFHYIRLPSAADVKFTKTVKMIVHQKIVQLFRNPTQIYIKVTYKIGHTNNKGICKTDT